jgi:hypothetical protein
MVAAPIMKMAMVKAAKMHASTPMLNPKSKNARIIATQLLNGFQLEVFSRISAPKATAKCRSVDQFSQQGFGFLTVPKPFRTLMLQPLPVMPPDASHLLVSFNTGKYS